LFADWGVVSIFGGWVARCREGAARGRLQITSRFSREGVEEFVTVETQEIYSN